MNVSKKLKNWLLAFLIAIFLVIGDRLEYFNWLKQGVGQRVNPVKHQLYLNKVTDDSDNQIDLAELQMIKAEVNKLRNENDRMRKLLGTKLPPNWQFVPANILGLRNSSMIIDIGSLMGIKSGTLVMALVAEEINNGILLGQVSKVNLMNSEIKLLTDKDMTVKAKTESGAKGIVRYQDDKLRLIEVLQEDSLNEDELVLTAGQDGFLPNLVIGKIGKIDQIDTEVFQQAEIQPLVSVNSLEQVFAVSL